MRYLLDFFLNFRDSILKLIERYHPFNVKYFKVVVCVVMTLLLGTVLILGLLSSKKVREIVTEDFNQQQLVIARHVASQIENRLETLRREIILLSMSPSIQYYEVPSMLNRLETTFSSIKYEGMNEIRFIEERHKKVHHIAKGHRCISGIPTDEDLEYLKWASDPANKGKINYTNISINNPGLPGKPTMNLITPVWQVSVDESHPSPSNKFSGVLIFVLDVSELVGNLVKEIRSGKTGYAWVIDENGIFLYHQEQSFIGKNAFEARKGKRPTISFERINLIQKEKMLKGKEGTSWYISGWHRNIEGEIKKLIAFTPVHIEGKGKVGRFWSVAVVAPISEVEGAIHSIHIQQFLLQAIVILIILCGGLFINFMILSWSNILEQEVTRKTLELKKSEQKYRSLVENAEDIIFTVDYNGNFLSINRYGASFFGKREDEIIGKNLKEIILWPSHEVLLLMIQSVVEKKESKQITHMITVNGREYWLNTNLRRLWDEEGNIYAVLGISRDITDRKKMEEHSYYTEKLASMGTLAAGVAHEINNPLTIILGFTDLLIEKMPKGSQEYDILKTIEKQALNAKRVVENLLSFARYKKHLEEQVNINENIENVLAVMNNTIVLNKINVVKDFEDDLPVVMGDAGELQQVFFNIINNAIYVMQGGGTLTISTKKDGDWVEIRISDTGCGIKKEHRPRIFDPLFTTKEVGKGTGLGLSVSYGIIKKHNGNITFETKTKEESNNSGTTFIIRLPAYNEMLN